MDIFGVCLKDEQISCSSYCKCTVCLQKGITIFIKISFVLYLFCISSIMSIVIKLFTLNFIDCYPFYIPYTRNDQTSILYIPWQWRIFCLYQGEFKTFYKSVLGLTFKLVIFLYKEEEREWVDVNHYTALLHKYIARVLWYHKGSLGWCNIDWR